MVSFDPEKVRSNVRQADTDDLLDRITAYRAGMEAAAIAIIEDELRSRGIKPEQIEAHDEACRREAIQLPDGTAAKCSFCRRPAVAQGWGWHRLWRKLPVFPRFLYYCKEHRPA